MNARKLELLAPAADLATARQAILHGADAVYIGPPSHGARKSAANSIEDIEALVDFAHQFRAKVYATVNTIVYENELKDVERLCSRLYHAGVDALIVQDMGILRLDIPPIALHASTQCDIRTPEKALFLQEAGFSQLVLARELSLSEIKAITDVVSVPVETFIHGALCVSYSGRCHASFALNGRSANRGECAQICRYPFTLTDSNGKVISKDKYLLSLKDFNLSASLGQLVVAGVSSFKIEGRLKDHAYVKNVTAFYNLQLNKIVAERPEEFSRSSFGESRISFSPRLDKSFNRGFTDYFIHGSKPLKIASLDTPKSQGEVIGKISDLNNGDGISFFDRKGDFTGVNVNRIEGNRIVPARKVEIPKGAAIFRTSDVKWNKTIEGQTSERKIKLDIRLDNAGVTARDERGVQVRLPLDLQFQTARKPCDYKPVFEKLGNTVYVLNSFESSLDEWRFYTFSDMTELRRRLIALLDFANISVYPFQYRAPENLGCKFPTETLDYRDNVANSLAEDFYRQHGVTHIEKAAEVTKALKKGDRVMTTRHCVLRELGLCKKEKRKPGDIEFPLFLNFDGGRFRLGFDCSQCQMSVHLD